jgi:hypothetical protein
MQILITLFFFFQTLVAGRNQTNQNLIHKVNKVLGLRGAIGLLRLGKMVKIRFFNLEQYHFCAFNGFDANSAKIELVTRSHLFNKVELKAGSAVTA